MSMYKGKVNFRGIPSTAMLKVLLLWMLCAVAVGDVYADAACVVPMLYTQCTVVTEAESVVDMCCCCC